MNKQELGKRMIEAIDNPPDRKQDIALAFKIAAHVDLINKIKANAAGVSEWEYKKLYKNW
tara:strand:- start:255 stop:434 length:180 start_codon:yes stop_codon:yes gene_type:complete